MSNNLIVNCDLKNANKLNISSKILTEDNASLFFGFTYENEQVVQFRELSFGFTIYDQTVNKNEIVRESYPRGTEQYLETDQQYILEYTLSLIVGKLYLIHAWVTNSEVYAENFYNFSIPIPAKPYNSWIWKDDGWRSQVPYPDDGKIYSWDEPSLSWIINAFLPLAGSHYFDADSNTWIPIPDYDIS